MKATNVSLKPDIVVGLGSTPRQNDCTFFCDANTFERNIFLCFKYLDSTFSILVNYNLSRKILVLKLPMHELLTVNHIYILRRTRFSGGFSAPQRASPMEGPCLT